MECELGIVVLFFKCSIDDDYVKLRLRITFKNSSLGGSRAYKVWEPISKLPFLNQVSLTNTLHQGTGLQNLGDSLDLHINAGIQAT